MITDGNVSRQACRIGHNNMVAEPAIMRHMHVGHQNALGSKRGHAPSLDSSPIDRDIFADDVVMADDDLGGFPFISKVLWRPSNRRKRMHFIPLPDFRPPIDNRMGEEPAPLSDHDMLPHDAERPNFHVLIEVRLRMNDRCWMYLHAYPLY